MTAVVGLVDGDTVYIGGDSAGVADWTLTVRSDAKVFHNGLYLFGFTDSFRLGQLIRYSLDPPTPVGDLEFFMATTFVDAVRACLKEGGWARKDADREEGGTFLVAVAGRLFRVEADYQVGETADGYDAIGCGGDAAHGALYATARLGLAARARVDIALRAAERHSAGVRGPFLVLTLEP